MKFLIGSILVFAAVSANAAEQLNAGSLQNSVPSDTLATLVSGPEENKYTFLEKVGKFLQNYTKQNNFEACGKIAVNGATKTFSVIVTTNHSHIGCLNNEIQDGYADTGETIHSHPNTEVFRVNAVDRVLLGYKFPLNKMLRGQIHPDNFSDEDFQKPGYLVAAGKLLYQHGIGTTRVIKESL